MPPGEWVHWQTGKSFRGPRLYPGQTYDLTDMGLYARAGAVIPIKDADESSHLAPQTLVLVVVAGDADVSNGTCQIYEDDGESNAYLPGREVFSLLEVTHNTRGGTATIHARQSSAHSYDNGLQKERTYRVEYRNNGTEPRQVRINGTAVQKRASAGVGPSMPALSTQGYSSTYLAMGFAHVRAGTHSSAPVMSSPSLRLTPSQMTRAPMPPTCEALSYKMHVVILVRNYGPSQLDGDNVW